VCCRVLQCVAVRYSVVSNNTYLTHRQRFTCRGNEISLCCNVLQCVAVCCSVLQCVAVRYFIICTSHIASTLEAGEMGLASKLACVVAPRTSNAPSAQKKTFCQVPHFYITRMRGWAWKIQLPQVQRTHSVSYRHTAAHCSTSLQHNATHCNTLS